ncbi:MAG TPA: cobalamin-independent methionine synthase II family protein [Steroidobacteraceae bacterium]
MSEHRIPVSHVGSLVRPSEFVALLEEKAAGRPVANFDAALRSAVETVVRRQVQAGVDIVSDGEFGKGIGWEQYVLERLSGFSEEPPGDPASGEPAVPRWGDFARFADFYREAFGRDRYLEHPMPCTGPIRYTGIAPLQRDISNLKAAAANAGAYAAFLPLVAPASATALSENRYYASDEEYIYAVAEALRVEYQTVLDAGLLVQIDDAHLPFMYDRMVPPGTDADYDRWARLRIEALNHALRGLDTSRVRYHICWGSWNGPHTRDVPLRRIVSLLLELNVGGYAIEAANARHEHEWQVWKEVKLPEGRKLMPGVVSHQTNVVEHPELVAERLERFASVVGRENVIAGTDCGFAQGPFVRRVHESIMWAKLESLAQGAALASSALWKRRSVA